MSTTPNNPGNSKKKGKSRFFGRKKEDPSSTNTLQPPTSTASNGANSPRPLLNRTDGLHNFGVALDLLKNVGEANEVLAPLKAVCGGLKALVDIAEAVQQNDDDLRDLRTRLGRQLVQLEQQYTTLVATKPKVGSQAVGNLIDALKEYISDLNKIEELLSAVENEDEHRAKRLFKKVWTSYSTREELKGCIRELDDSFQLCMNSVVGFIAHQTVMMRNDLANDAISRLPCADARGNQHDSCLEGTRMEILDEINKWATDSAARPVLGLVDQAGTGKSTISTHMAQKWEKAGLLVARFFFSLPLSVIKGTEFATTLARDLADNSPPLRSLILDAINDQPNIKGYSIKEKLDWFVLTPLKRLREDHVKALDQVRTDIQERSFTKMPRSFHAAIMETAHIIKLKKTYMEALEQVRKCPTDTMFLSVLEKEYMLYARELENSYSEAIGCPPIIIIDALDECTLPDRQVILEFILNSLATEPDRPPFKLFLTCRPESDITSKTHDPKHQHLVHQVDFEIFETNRSAHDDITLYATKYLSELLTPQQLLLFITRAAGLFIWASTAKVFLENALDPSTRFNNLLAQSTASSPLDSLYSTVLLSAIESIGSDQVGLLKKILQAICAAQVPLSASAIDELLALGSGVARRVVTRLGSVLSDHEAVQVLHPTFVEYFLSSRQPDCLGFTGGDADLLLADGSLSILCSSQLKYDICCITQPFEFDLKNRDIRDLRQRLERNTTPGLRYAAVHGLTHVARSVENNTVLTKLKVFLENNLLHWIELMSLLKAIFRVMELVYHLKIRLEGTMLKAMDPFTIEGRLWCQEIIDLVQPFQAAIEETAMQVYFSALTFVSSKSKIYNFYFRRFKDIVPIVLRGPSRSQTMTLAGHTRRIECLSFSPDGQRIATGSLDCTIQLWDVATGAAVGKPLIGHTHGILCLSFSPDGKILATASNDRTTRLWDVATDAVVGEPLIDRTGQVWRLSFSPDSKILVIVSTGGTVRLWGVATGAVVGEPLTGYTDRVTCLSLSPDGKLLATGSNKSTFRRWDIATGAVVGEPLIGRIDQIMPLSLSSNVQLFATRSNKSTVRLWDIATGAVVGEPLIGHTGRVQCLSFSPDSKTLVTGSTDGTVQLWDVATAAVVGKPLIDRTGQVWRLSFSPDSKILVIVSTGGTVRLWDIATGVVVGEIRLTDPIMSLSLSPDGKLLATGSDKSTVGLWDVATGAVVGEPLIGHTGQVECLSFSPDSKTLVMGSTDGTVRLWDVATSAAISESFIGHNNRIQSLLFSPNNQLLATGSVDGTVCLWDVTTGVAVGEPLIGHTSWIWCLSFSPDNKLLATGSNDRTIRLWDVATGTVVGEPLIVHTGWIWCLSFSPDGKILATGSNDRTVRLWDVATGTVVGEPLIGHTKLVGCLSFSPDGRMLATGSDDCTVRLWDAATGATIPYLLEHTTYVHDLAFHVHNTSTLLTINNSSAIWNISTEPPIKVPAPQQMSTLPDPFRFQNPQTFLCSSNCTWFSLPSNFSCTKFLSHKGLVAYGGSDGSVIIIDCRHLMDIST